MADNTFQNNLYESINWMCFAGNTPRYWGIRSSKEPLRVATPYKDIWADHHGATWDDSYKEQTQDLTRYDKTTKATQYYAIIIQEREKTPAKKRTNSTDISSSNGTYVADYGFFDNGSVSYTCLLMPRYGDHYSMDACYDMYMQFISQLSSIVGYGVLQDSYEDRWCYAYFSGVSDQHLYSESMSFKISFSCRPEWYDNNWASMDNCVNILDFSTYTGKDSSGNVTADKMYNIKSTCPYKCPPILYVVCDDSASSWFLRFPESPTGLSDKDITLNFSSAGYYFIDCIQQGYSGEYTDDSLTMMTQKKQELLYTSEPSEYIFKDLPYQYPYIERGNNYIYGEGIKTLRVWPMYWQL